MRRKSKELCDLTREEYVELKRETDARIAHDYAPGNVVAVKRAASGPDAPAQLGICYLDLFVDFVSGKQLVSPWALLQDGYELALGYNTFETVTWTGQVENIDEWVTKNVSERRKRKKRN